MTTQRNKNDTSKVDQAANDEIFQEPPPDPPSIEVLEFIDTMLNAPEDLPGLPAARVGLCDALEALAAREPSAAPLYESVASAIGGPKEIAKPTAVSAEIAAAFSKRRGHHGHYLCFAALGIHSAGAPAEGRALVAPVAVTLAIWAVRRCLDGWAPPKHQYSRITEALLRPQGSAARAWVFGARERYAADNLYEFKQALARHPEAAARLGFAVAPEDGKGSRDQIADFNRRFRRRMDSLREYKSTDDEAGAGGHGTLSAAALKRAGRELLAGFRVGDAACLHVALEIVSHLTSEQIQRLPVQLKGIPPAGALAWLDVPAGDYWYSLVHLVEKGARPEPATEALYERTVQVVRIVLTPPLAVALRVRASRFEGDCIDVAQLLGEVAHGPHDAVAGTGPYRVTTAKLQASLPALLVQAGHWRWSAALATSSPYLVSFGRRSYSAARTTTVHQTVEAAYALLGWPLPTAMPDRALIGAFTVPKVMAVATAFSTLAEAANATWLALTTYEEVVACLNAHAAYLALLLALAYALRARIAYPLPTRGLRAGEAIKFNDKDVHEVSMPAVPTLQIVRDAMDGWERLINTAILCLRDIGSEEARELAHALAIRLADHDAPGWVFTINAAGHLEPVGAATWFNSLPLSMRLVRNFARQFWPFHLAELGVTQRDTDILMRHQMPAHHPGSTHNVRPERDTHDSLLRAMSTVVHDKLGIDLPIALARTRA